MGDTRELASAAEKKLDPANFPEMTGEMAAILGCVFKKEYTEPQFVRLYITPDGLMIAQWLECFQCGSLIGRAEDFEKDWAELLDVAGLTREEKAEVNRMLAAVLVDLRISAEA